MSQGLYPLDQSGPAVPKAPTSKCFREIRVFPLVVIRSPKALTFPDQARGVSNTEPQSSHLHRDSRVAAIFSLRRALLSERPTLKFSSFLIMNKTIISLLSDRNNVLRVEKGAGQVQQFRAFAALQKTQIWFLAPTSGGSQPLQLQGI